MSQLNVINLTSTLVAAVEFAVRLKQGLSVSWATTTAATGALQTKIFAKMRPATAVAPRKVSLRVEIPNEVTVGASTKNEFATMFIEVVVPENFPVAKIEQLRELGSGLLSEAQIADMTDNGGFAY